MSKIYNKKKKTKFQLRTGSIIAQCQTILETKTKGTWATLILKDTALRSWRRRDWGYTLKKLPGLSCFSGFSTFCSDPRPPQKRTISTSCVLEGTKIQRDESWKSSLISQRISFGINLGIQLQEIHLGAGLLEP